MPLHIKLFVLVLAWTSQSASAVIDRPFLYEVVTPTGKVSHLFGSLHVGIGLDDFSAALTAEIKNSRIVIFERKLSEQLFSREAPPANPVSGEVRRELVRLGTPAPIAEQLGDEDCFAAARFRKKWALPFLDGEIMRLVAREKVATAELESRMVLNEAAKLDKPCSLSALAAAAGGLEAWLKKFDSEVSDIVATYRKGDAGTIFTSDVPSMRLRNLVWLPALTTHLNEGRAFIVVGAAHLYGYSGLIELLRDRKFIVRRVPFEN